MYTVDSSQMTLKSVRFRDINLIPTAATTDSAHVAHNDASLSTMFENAAIAESGHSAANRDLTPALNDSEWTAICWRWNFRSAGFPRVSTSNCCTSTNRSQFDEVVLEKTFCKFHLKIPEQHRQSDWHGNDIRISISNLQVVTQHRDPLSLQNLQA